MSELTYEQIIARKSAAVAASGFVVPDDQIAPHLLPHQRDLTQWALRRGRSAIFADTGLGKGPMLLEWSRHVSEHGRVLILAPLAVGPQLEREGVKFGVDAKYLRADDPMQRIVVTNYEMLHVLDPSQFVGVVLDECFAADTMIDTPTGRRQIATLRVGDTIYNASGIDTISDVHRREVPYAIRVSYGGSSCIASPNHPFLTQRGWVGARALRAGDHVLKAAAAVRLVLEGVRPQDDIIGCQKAAVLRDVLLSEMAHDPTGRTGQGVQPDGLRQDGEGDLGMVADPSGGRTAGADHGAQSDSGSDRPSEDLPPIERDEAHTFRAWWQRSGLDEAAVRAAGCTWINMGHGMAYITGPTDARLPDALQARLSAARSYARDRGGWQLAPREEGSGPQEGRDAGFVRVDGVEILEPGHPELDRYRDAAGKLYFYDLGGTWHPSFSVNGCIVHNSSILKAFDGKTKQRLIDAFRETPYKLCCTATPAPNDFTELGNHSEFLGIKTRAEMLAEFFVHDGGSTQDWRIKGHAVQPFWRWVATWGAVVKMPSDLGYPDGAFKLPPLRMVEHVVPAGAHDIASSGQLFATQARSLMEQRAVKRATIDARAKKVADLARRHAWDGNQSTSETVEQKWQRIRSMQHGSSRDDQGHPTKTANTCESTTKQTRPSSSERASSKTSIMNDGESSMRTAKRSARSASVQPKDGSAPTLTESAMLTSVSNTESGSPTMSGCSQINAVCAPSAAAETTTEDDSTSITATVPESSVDSYVDGVILDSVNSTTTSIACIEPSNICNAVVVWCELNDEQDAIANELGDLCVSIQGSDCDDDKISRHERWLRGKVAILVTKASQFGWGLNWQHCHNQIFAGPSNSYERTYQAVRRSWRYGQVHEVTVDIVRSELEEAVIENYRRKERDAAKMSAEMTAHVGDAVRAEVRGAAREFNDYNPQRVMEIPSWLK